MEAFALPDKLALTVAHAVYTAYCRHGAPDNIITDQGREFVNEVSSGVIKHSSTCRYCFL